MLSFFYHVPNNRASCNIAPKLEISGVLAIWHTGTNLWAAASADTITKKENKLTFYQLSLFFIQAVHVHMCICACPVAVAGTSRDSGSVSVIEIGLEPTRVVLHLVTFRRHPARAQLRLRQHHSVGTSHAYVLNNATFRHYFTLIKQMQLLFIDVIKMLSYSSRIHECVSKLRGAVRILHSWHSTSNCSNYLTLNTFLQSRKRSSFAHRFTFAIVKSCCAHVQLLHLTPPAQNQTCFIVHLCSKLSQTYISYAGTSQEILWHIKSPSSN